MANERQLITSKVMEGKGWRILLVVAMLVATFSFATIFRSSVAHAGSNGQQVGAYCWSGGIQFVSLHGTNQNGQDTFVYADNLWNAYIGFSGSWWVGQLTLQYEVRGSWSSKVVNVPRSQNGDWYNVNVC